MSIPPFQVFEFLFSIYAMSLFVYSDSFSLFLSPHSSLLSFFSLYLHISVFFSSSHSLSFVCNFLSSHSLSISISLSFVSFCMFNFNCSFPSLRLSFICPCYLSLSFSVCLFFGSFSPVLQPLHLSPSLLFYFLSSFYSPSFFHRSTFSLFSPSSHHRLSLSPLFLF